MHPWLSWIRWLNPIFYSIEALLANELDGLTFDCVPRQLAPLGPGYTGGPAGCAITGAQPGTTFVTGSAYLETALDFSKSHVWRNFGILMAWWIFYVVMGCLAIESVPAAGSAKSVTLYKSGSDPFERTNNDEDAKVGTESSDTSIDIGGGSNTYVHI